jgi:hypothetical protein
MGGIVDKTSLHLCLVGKDRLRLVAGKRGGRMLPVAVVGVATILLTSDPALAQHRPYPPRPVGAFPFPQYNIGMACQAFRNPAGCRAAEMDAAGKLAVVWPQLAPARQLKCGQKGAQAAAGGSYIAALWCAKRP